MQQRFCECGFPVWVQYRFSGSQCRPLFWSRIDELGEHLRRCPCCFKRLNINEIP